MSTNYSLLTYQDAYEHLLDVFSLEGSAREARNVRRAIGEAYSDLPGMRTWKRYLRTLRITTTAEQETGTVTYVAATRLLTLDSATWPEDAAFGEVEIDDVLYDVEERVSSTVLLLTEGACPTSDISTATEYAWRRDRYELPDNFQSMGVLVDRTNRRELSTMTADEASSYKYTSRQSGEPRGYCITAMPEYGGAVGIQFVPTPTTARNFGAAYIASPRALRTLVYNTGTLSCTADSKAITGVGTAFTDFHAGCVLRIANSATDTPTNQAGYSDDSYEPWVEQLVIRSVTDGTTLVTQQAASQTLAGKKFTISDPIDMDASVMETFFMRLAEARYSRLTARDDRREREDAADAAYLEAAAAEKRFWNSLESLPPGGRIRLYDLASSFSFD